MPLPGNVLRIPRLLDRIAVVLHVEVPAQQGMLGSDPGRRGYLIDDAGVGIECSGRLAGVDSGVQQSDPVARVGQPGGDWSAACSCTDNDVVELGRAARTLPSPRNDWLDGCGQPRREHPAREGPATDVEIRRCTGAAVRIELLHLRASLVSPGRAAMTAGVSLERGCFSRKRDALTRRIVI